MVKHRHLKAERETAQLFLVKALHCPKTQATTANRVQRTYIRSVLDVHHGDGCDWSTGLLDKTLVKIKAQSTFPFEK